MKKQSRGVTFIAGQKKSGKTEFIKKLLAKSVSKQEPIIIIDPANEYKSIELGDKASKQNIVKHFDKIVAAMQPPNQTQRIFRVVNKNMALKLLQNGFKNCSVIVEIDLAVNRWLLTREEQQMFYALCMVVRSRNYDLCYITQKPVPNLLQNASQAVLFKGANIIQPDNYFISAHQSEILQLLPDYSFYAVDKTGQQPENLFYLHPFGKVEISPIV